MWKEEEKQQKLSGDFNGSQYTKPIGNVQAGCFVAQNQIVGCQEGKKQGHAVCF